MTGSFAKLLLWAPRVLGIATCIFIGMFALDAFAAGKPTREALIDFVIHLTPAIVLLVVVALSWRWEWIGGTIFLALAIVYVITMARGRIDWIALIAGPLVLVGILFLWSWRYHRELRGPG